MTEEPRSLQSRFKEAEALRRTTTSNTAEENLRSVVSKYEECLKIAGEISLFSPNETLDDVASSDLRYFLINYQLADTLQRLNTNRRQALLNAREQFDKFLRLLDSYDILSQADAGLYERYTESPSSFSTASTTDAAARRQTKISRFKDEKALKTKLEYLEKNPSIATNDEAVVRELSLTNIHLRVLETFQSLEGIAQELEILSLAPPTPPSAPKLEDDRERNRGKDSYAERLDHSHAGLSGRGPILDSRGKPLRPFTLLDKRSELQKGVFRPGHNLPTMSIDEYLEEERRRGGIIEGGGPQSGVRAQIDDDNIAVADAETLKARAWDDFKDDNPRGAGNTMNMG